MNETAAAHAQHKAGCVIHRGGCCTCGAPMTVEEKERSNTWDHLSDFVRVWNAKTAGQWEWYLNSRCKYVELRIDMRTGHCIIRDREGKRLNPDDLAHQYRSADEISKGAAASVETTDALSTTKHGANDA